MDIALVFAFVVALILAIAGTVRLPQLWSGRHRPQNVLEIWLPPSIARGVARAVPLDVAFIWICAAFVAASGFGSVEPVVGVWNLPKILAFLAVALLAVMLSIVFFNRPKTLVPPYLRSQPGAMAEWVSRGQRQKT